MKRVACALAGATTVLATSLLCSSARANSRADWTKCLSTAETSPAERISNCTAALASGTDQWAASRAHYLRGLAQFAKGDFEAAVADLSLFIQSYPNDEKGYQARAAAHLRQRKLDLAIADYTSVIEINPSSPVSTYYAYVYRAEIYCEKDDTDRSIADATKAIEINPKFAFAYGVRGVAYVAKRDVEPAINDLNRAIELDPAYKVAYVGRAAAYKLRGDIDLAIADYNEAVRLDPQYKAAFAGRAHAYKLKGDLDLSIADYDQVIRLDPQSASTYFYRALTYWQSGLLSRSLTDLDQAVRLNPKSAYPALWREIIGKRSDEPSQLADAARQIDMKKWPAPIVNLFLGAATPEQVLAAADDSDPKKKQRQVCEANFYTAELAMQRGSREDARRPLELAAADCPKTFVESWAAGRELKVLSAKR